MRPRRSVRKYNLVCSCICFFFCIFVLIYLSYNFFSHIFTGRVWLYIYLSTCASFEYKHGRHMNVFVNERAHLFINNGNFEHRAMLWYLVVKRSPGTSPAHIRRQNRSQASSHCHLFIHVHHYINISVAIKPEHHHPSTSYRLVNVIYTIYIFISEFLRH